MFIMFDDTAIMLPFLVALNLSHKLILKKPQIVLFITLSMLLFSYSFLNI